MDVDERMERLQGLFDPLERGHSALVRHLESLFDSMPQESALLDGWSMSRDPAQAYRQRRQLEAMRYLMGPGQLDPSAAFLTPGFGMMGSPGDEAMRGMLTPQWQPRGEPMPMRRSPWLDPRSAMQQQMLLAGDWERMNEGLPMHQPPGQQLPLRPYPFMPQQGVGSPFRTYPQGPVRNIAGMRA